MDMEGLDSHKNKINPAGEISSGPIWDFNWDGDDFKMVDSTKLIIYQVFIDIFFGEISRTGDDYIDLDKKLGYLKVLGINALELVPYSYPDRNGPVKDDRQDSGNKNRSKFRPIAFANLVKKAHIHGIAIIMVVDYRYSGPEVEGGEYFQDRLYTSTENRMVDLERSEVRRSIRDHIFMWLEKYHCDGIRVKDTNSIRNTSVGYGENRDTESGLRLLQEINGEVKTKYPNKLLIAEDIGEKRFITEPLVNGGLGFDIQWDSKFLYNIRFVLTQARDEDRAIQCIVDALANSLGSNPFSRVVFCESDSCVSKGIPRLPEEIYPERPHSPYAIKRSILGAVLTFTAPGIPLLFQGQEFVDPAFFGRNHLPDWKKMSQLKGVQQLFGDLIKLRKSDYNDYAGLQGNQLDFLHFNQQDNILVYQRGHPEYYDHRVMVVINLSYADYKKYVIGLSEKGRWKLIFNSSSRLYDESGTFLSVKDFTAREKPYDGFPYQGSFALPCYSALLFIHYAVTSRSEQKELG